MTTKKSSSISSAAAEIRRLAEKSLAPARHTKKRVPQQKNNKYLTSLERRELELHGLFDRKTQKHGGRRRRHRRRTTRKH